MNKSQKGGAAGLLAGLRKLNIPGILIGNIVRTDSYARVLAKEEAEEEVRQALEAGADVILMDNMDCAARAEAVRLVDGRALLEASGGITDDTLRAVAETGVDIISIGALTHSVKAMDISMKIR